MSTSALSVPYTSTRPEGGAILLGATLCHGKKVNEHPHGSLNNITPVKYRRKMLLIMRISLQDISHYQQHIIIIMIREKAK